MTTILQQRLRAMRAAAPQAAVHLLSGANGFTVLLGEAKAAHECSPLVRLTDHSDKFEEMSAWEGFIPLPDMPAALEAITTRHSVALMDTFCEEGYKGRPVMICLLPYRGEVKYEVENNQPEDEWA